MAVTWECRGYGVAAPRGHKKAGWLPFTIVWGGKQNTQTRKGK